MAEKPLLERARALRARFQSTAHVYTAGELNKLLLENLIGEADGTRPKRKIYRSNLRSLDRILYGFEPGSPVIFAARPGVGKSILACNLSDGFGSQGIDTAVIWAEDGLDAFARRSVARRQRVRTELLREGNEENVLLYQQTLSTISDSELWPVFVISPKLRFTMGQVCELLRELRPKVVIVDHLGEIKLETKELAQRHYVLGETVRLFRQTCRECETVPIMMVQMNRDIEKEKNPFLNSKLSHIFGSGEIEQAARVVGFVEKERPEDDFYEGPVKYTIDIKKNTNGRLGVARFILYPEYMLLEDSR